MPSGSHRLEAIWWKGQVQVSPQVPPPVNLFHFGLSSLFYEMEMIILQFTDSNMPFMLRRHYFINHEERKKRRVVTTM